MFFDKSRRRNVWLILGACFLIFLGFFSWNRWQDEGPIKIIEKHLEALRSNKTPEAYAFTARKFQSTVPLSDFRELLKANSVLTSYIDRQISLVDFNENEAFLLTILTRSDKDLTGVKYTVVKEDGVWKILKIWIDNTASNNFASSVDSTEWLHSIDMQLMALRSKDIENAYNKATSKGFRDFSSLDGFRQFVDFNSILSSHKNYVLGKQAIRTDNIIVDIILNPDNEAIPIQYTMGKEDGQWKILHLDMTIANLSKFQELLKDTNTHAPIKKQLAALKDRDILQAYSDPTSPAFRKDVSFEVFQELIHQYPILMDYQSIEFKNPRLDNGTCFLIVELKGKDDSIYTLEYTLALEDNQWKIWTFRGWSS
ncbi:MAG: DUF4864 domain-containing protein [Bacteriovoracaceae bacterium]|nr:DUF4864 domain-containing protein [Bacteriovoracaceae bacterium]